MWFCIGRSSLNNTFKKEVADGIRQIPEIQGEHRFMESDFRSLPCAVQKYLQHCGYIGSEKKEYLCMKYRDVDFMQGKKGQS